MPDVLLKDQFGEPVQYKDIDTVVLNTNEQGGTATYISEHLIKNQVQSDWTQTDKTHPGYIWNKPESFEAEPELPEILPEDEGKVLGILNGDWQKVFVEASSNEQIQADWNQTDFTKPDFVKNKPFYEEIHSASFSFETVESAPTTKVNVGDITAHKIADFIPPLECIPQSVLTMVINGEQADVVITSDMIMISTDDYTLITIDNTILIFVAYNLGTFMFDGITFTIPASPIPRVTWHLQRTTL
jgi:hypothetical protein